MSRRGFVRPNRTTGFTRRVTIVQSSAHLKKMFVGMERKVFRADIQTCLARPAFVITVGRQMRNPGDTFGKNLMRDVFELRGLAETEAEVPPGNAKRIDVWFVPDEGKIPSAPQFTDILEEIAAEPSALEIWTGAVSEHEFHVTFAKRENFRQTLEQRDKRSWTRPMLWHVCARRPKTVIESFGFVSTNLPGRYRLRNRGWRVQLVVVGELPKTRSTLLFRLLGRGLVRRDALREWYALPDDAWEKDVAYTWIVKVGLEVRVNKSMTTNDRELVMDARAWARDHQEKLARKVEARVLRKVEAQRAEEQRQLEAQRAEEQRRFQAQLEAQRAEEQCRFETQLAEERRHVEAQLAEERRHAEVNQLVFLFEHRLGRSLTTKERTVVRLRAETLGSAHVAGLVLDLSPPKLGAWLKADSSARKG